ncbi:hypothetical protein D623_10033693 [Myotis brandtii]|uniref:Uncharacterized protein n=1 Tax=Myotis brandtii TaxID=109478 RepID=S7MF25_MYOBR|nr:hypothetical protein D623_10033693 [Myotis brandtii]
MSLTQGLTDLGAWYVGLFAHEASAVTDDGKGHGTSSQKAQELVLAPPLASSAPLTATQTSDSFGFLTVTVRTVPVQLILENCEQRRSLWKCLVNVQTSATLLWTGKLRTGQERQPQHGEVCGWRGVRVARCVGGEVCGWRGLQAARLPVFQSPRSQAPVLPTWDVDTRW